MIQLLPYEILGKIFDYCNKIIYLRIVCSEFKYIIDECEYFNLDKRKFNIRNDKILLVMKKITNVKYIESEIYECDGYYNIKNMTCLHSYMHVKLPNELVKLNYTKTFFMFSFAQIKNLENLKILICRFCIHIDDRYLPNNIVELKCDWTRNIRDLSRLKKLKILHCTGCAKIIDNKLPVSLIELKCGQTPIKNIRHLINLIKLTALKSYIKDKTIPISLIKLECSGSFNIWDLKHLINLKKIICYYNRERIISNKNLPSSITTLKCSSISNFDSIKHLKNLKKLHILNRKISDKRKIKNCIISYKK